MPDITISISDLERMLNQQKDLVIDNLSGSSSSYNTESTDGCLYSLKIDKEKFKAIGMKSRFPNDFEVLKKHVK